MASDLRHRIRAGEPLIGTWVSLGDPACIEVLGQSGFDFLLLDGEHAPIDERTLLAQVIAGKAAGAPVMYRVRSNDVARIKIALNLGASMGVLGGPDPKLDQAIDRIATLCSAASMTVGIDVAEPQQIPAFRAQGLSLFTYGLDVAYLSEGAGAAAAALRSALSGAR